MISQNSWAPAETQIASRRALAASITRAASRQTYYTICCLVDRGRVPDAYRAYAYFRWLDDWLDQGTREEPERLAFVDRQRALVDLCYRDGRPGYPLAEEETMLVDLIRSDREKASGLQSYIRNMLAVMAFDAGRRGRLISADELADYSRRLAVAVTEALHYFIGHDSPSPRPPARYLAVTAAHITHMLRDTLEDVEAGYYNIPREFLATHHIDPQDVECDAYRIWVQRRVQLARSYFEAGKNYLSQVANTRCRLAGYAYIARFEVVLDLIARDGYRLRVEYPERRSLGAGLQMGWSLLSLACNPHSANRPAQPVWDQARGER